MKSLSLKVIILLMAALVLSASGCSNENERSSPEGTVEGFYKELKQLDLEKAYSYYDPREFIEEEIQAYSELARDIRKATRKRKIKSWLTDLKTTLVSEKESLVWKGDKWGNRKSATVEVGYKFKGKNRQHTVNLVKLDNKWYITEK